MILPQISTAGVVESDFYPHPLVRSKHIQTISPSLFQGGAGKSYIRQRLETPDGDFLDLDWFPQNQHARNLVVLMHGLGGSSASNYIKRVGSELVNAGFRVVVFNLRGATGPNRLPQTYHSGETADLQYMLNHLIDTIATDAIYIAGFSLGGNMILKWLGENQGQLVIKKAVAVSVPFDLSAVSNRLNKGGSKFYRFSLLKNMRAVLRQKESLLKNIIDLRQAYAAKTFHEFDDIVTAPLNSFRDVDDYYSRSSSKQFLRFIDTKTLIVQSRDDPFVPISSLPDATELGPGVTLELSDKGGHVGFIARGRGLSLKYWLPERISAFFSKN